MEESQPVAIRTENLAKAYRSGLTELVVFRELNLQIRTGESVALVGTSGAGKSSLLHILGGLDRPSEGKVYFGTKGITDLTDAELSEFRNREIGFVWQSHSLLPEFTALENVMMPLLIRSTPTVVASSAAMEKLQEVGLAARSHHRAGELSGGEQQRVSLARALVTKPSVLLADEPTGNLDHKTAETVVSLLDELHQKHRLTSFIVTHNLAFAKRCDRVLILDKGRLETIPREGTNGSNYV